MKEDSSSIQLCKDANNYFQAYWNLWGDDDDEWVHKSLPIGPHWATKEEHKTTKWAMVGTLDWTEINYIKFIIVASGGVDPKLYIDDLHFAGKIIRSAYHSDDISNNDEVQRVMISRTAMDDSGKADDDTGSAARYTYAELLRRMNIPKTIVFTTKLREDLLPGQKIYVEACRTASGAYEFDAPARVT